MTREGILKNKEVFDAWLAGARVQYRDNYGNWVSVENPTFYKNVQYRIFDPYLELKQAFDKGETLQILVFDQWKDWGKELGCPRFDKPVDNYRIKPESKYVPFTFEDSEQLIGEIIVSKDKTVYDQITYISKDMLKGGFCKRTYEELLEGFLFLDGSPCGKLKE